MTLSDSQAAEVAPVEDLRTELLRALEQAEAGEAEPQRAEEPASAAADVASRDAEASEPDTETKDVARQADGGSKPDKLAPPKDWPSDARTAWDKLPRAAQEALLADLEAGRLVPAARVQGVQNADPLRETLKSYERLWSGTNVPPEVYVRNLLEAASFLERNPVEGLKWLAQSYRVDLSRLAASSGEQPSQPTDAKSAAGDPKLIELERKTDAALALIQAREHAEAMAEIEAWKNEKGPDGNLLRPFYADVGEQAMATAVLLLKQQAPHLSRRELLQRAYEMEVHRRPELRQKLIDAEVQARIAQREAEARKAAEEAKRKGVSVRNNASIADTQRESLRDELLRRLSGG